MKNKAISLLLLISFLSVSSLLATVDYLAVNHLTQQLYWAATDHPPGWTGWENIPDGVYQNEEVKYLSMGYSFAQNPFLIEEIILLVLVCALFMAFLIKRKRTFS